VTPPDSLISRPGRVFAGYAFDLDGTVYLGDALLAGSARLFAALRELECAIVFVSNNPTRTPEQYVDKLRRLGIEAGLHEVINTVVTTVDWIVSECPGARVFAIAEEPLRRALHEAGVQLSEHPDQIDVVIASYDRTLDYRKLQIAFDALWRRADTRLLATNPDPYCPTPAGGEPDAAAVIAALEACTGRRCERHFGKPGEVMMDAVRARLDRPAGDCVIVGDRVSTDIAAARTAGMDAALVLTGETSAAEAERLAAPQRPRYVLARLDQLLPAREWERRGWAED
jgi:HAD superfamily hydrolase (TIGR01450 family)